MLAKISPSSPSPLPTPAPPSFTATFNPSPSPPATNQFLLNGGSVDSLILVEEGATEITISITLEEGASFFITSSPGPIVWSLPPDSGEPNYVVSGGNNNILTFTVPAPPHVLHPWVFRFIAIVNVGDDPSSQATGVRSQNIYIAKPLGEDPADNLVYSPDDGNFSLVAALDSPQVGINLGEDLVLVNVHGSRPFSVTLVSDPSLTAQPLFAPPGIYWSSGPAPSWISFTPIGEPTSTLSFTTTTDPSTAGNSIGLQFAIVLNNGTPESTTILSPDPILINATIGDGG